MTPTGGNRPRGGPGTPTGGGLEAPLAGGTVILWRPGREGLATSDNRDIDTPGNILVDAGCGVDAPIARIIASGTGDGVRPPTR